MSADKKKASLNKCDRIWLWVIALFSFTAFTMLSLLLSLGIYQLFFSCCEDRTARRDTKPCLFCCRQTRACCEDAREKPACDQTKPDDEVTLNLGNNPQVDRLVKAVEGLSRQQLVIEQQEPCSFTLKLEDSPQVERLISAVETRSPRYSVTEQRLPSFLAEKTACGNARFDMSDFIRFDWMKSDLSPAAEKQVANFMGRSGQVKKLLVFSFASPDGRTRRNKELAKERARAVVNKIRRSYSGCVSIKPMGEDHPINGIANSRSVVIAACRTAPGEAETDGTRDTTRPSCPGAG